MLKWNLHGYLMKTYIYLIRHGIAPFSIEHERTGGYSLSEQGKLDAKRVAELLSNEDIDVIVSSSYFENRYWHTRKYNDNHIELF